MRTVLLSLFISPLFLFAQKKPLDHSVYDGWQSIGERTISNDGKWVVYTVTPQEGDAELVIQSSANSAVKKMVPRGYNPVITEDSRFVVFKIKPFFKDTRDARIKKKKPEDFPKDSIAIMELGKDNLWKTAKIKSFKTPQKAAGWVAFQKEKEPVASKPSAPTQKTVDSLKRSLDSLMLLVTELKNIKGGNRDMVDADDEPTGNSTTTDGSDLVLKRLGSSQDKTFKNVVDYTFSPNGKKLMMRVSKSARDANSKNAVVLYNLASGKLDTILKGGNDFKGFTFSEDGYRAAFVAERDTSAKALQRFYELYVYNEGDDSATLIVDKKSCGMRIGNTVSENGTITFSKNGNRLFFGTAPIVAPKDTSLIDIDLVKVDVWHYNDDYLQTQQLFNLQNDLKRSYLAVYDFTLNKMEPLGSKDIPTIYQTAQGDGQYFIAVTDTGRRVASQWSGNTLKDVYALEVATGKMTLVKKNHSGQIFSSYTGKYIVLYDNKNRNYWAWDGQSLKNITSGMKVPLYNEENDVPSDPSPYGIFTWHQNDSFAYVYDRYDMWRLDPTGKQKPVNLTGNGRSKKDVYRYVRLDNEERFFTTGQPLYFRVQNETTKKAGLVQGILTDQVVLNPVVETSAYNYNLLAKAKDAPAVIYTKESYTSSPDLYVQVGDKATKLSELNPQQAQYNWGTAELFTWKTFTGKQSEGILYKPEDFDPKKKYPMIIYFYEKLSDGLYNYNAPSPTPSRLNIPFYVSRGYLVFAPDITYTKGQPGKDAYNYIVSGAQALAKNSWVDAKNMAIQGQSWGGYQVAALITQTSMFKAAWAGAPVANMTSAYGGIRWESGNNRQFQYEKGQSRIGATLWEAPNKYIESSPLFQLPKVKTPLVIMSNDADGAVPWYQGIEFFTAMRRLGKPVWLLNYNGEAHNLVERKNRKDIQIRQQQYFDWLLKGEKPAKWLVEGVPAVKKGKEWGLEIVDYKVAPLQL
ncbi:prolyl oligopeptidase family serine peptidase [Flavisolibacter tropicus]|uniref:Peptidase S9 n=1 Tax=Flavisolibacter tropicus TaxID=1492898 RepID=A0A172TS99_9BACT|nr:prolyl oligopeptidase family serine peptidase [Flavisolibacter tropicus]ANE49910.1 peptidase S9 [Flavisolibacter tropicus]